jgi:hypothetical protein
LTRIIFHVAKVPTPEVSPKTAQKHGFSAPENETVARRYPLFSKTTFKAPFPTFLSKSNLTMKYPG